MSQVLKKNATAWAAGEPLFESTTMQTAQSNRRRSIRYPLRGLAVVQWDSHEGVRKHTRGWTKDVSEAGAYVVSPHCPREGDQIQMVLRFPMRPLQRPGPTTEISMSGKVLRIDRDAPHGRELGFAVRTFPGDSNSESDGFDSLDRDHELRGGARSLQTN